ncbi:unnamed protein product [Musa textilis]
MNGSEYSNDSYFWTIGDGVTSLVCTCILFSLITTILDTSWYLISNVQQIRIHLSIDFYLPFELISIIILVSLIGAITMARQ